MADEFLGSKLIVIFALALGWPINLLLIWLIIYRTNEALRVWSRVLLQSAIIDFILLAIAFIVQPVLISDGQIIYYFSNGPFAKFFAQYFREIPYFVFLSWLEFAKHAVAVQCFYRWLVICRGQKLSRIHYVLLLCIPAALVVFQISIVPFGWPSQYDGKCSICPKDQDILFLMRQNTQYSIFVELIWLICNLATFSVILATNFLIWMKTRRTLVPESPHRQEINRQVGLVLLIQAILPFALSTLPITIILVYIAAGLQIPGWLSILFTQTWTSCVYPILAILLIRHYRRGVQQIICGKKTQNTQQIVQCGPQIGEMQNAQQNLEEAIYLKKNNLNANSAI